MQTFEELGKLVKLKFVRLESGGSINEDTLGRALVKLTRYVYLHPESCSRDCYKIL